MNEPTEKSQQFEALEILSSLPVGVVSTGDDDRICWANKCARTQLGIEEVDLVGRKRSALPQRRALALSKSVRRIKLPSGSGGSDRWLDCISQKVDGAEGISELSCFVDTTYYEQKQVSVEQRADFHEPERFAFGVAQL